jgi:hypothetical protein
MKVVKYIHGQESNAEESLPGLYFLSVLLRFTLQHVPPSALQEKGQRQKA